MQTYHALFLLTHTHQDDLSGAHAAVGQILTLDFHLVRWDDGHTAPCDDFRAEEVDGHRRHTTPSAFTLESGDGTWIGDEEGWLFPYEREELVEVIGCGSPIACADLVARSRLRQESELLVVDEFPLLTFLDALHREAQLLFELVVGSVVEVAHTGVYTHHGL